MDLHEDLLDNRAQRFGSDACFICGLVLPDGSSHKTREHIFPQWLLRELNLRESNFRQINGRRVFYKRMTIPCCAECNNIDFSGIENRVKEAYLQGYEAFSNLERKDLFLWLGKIYYGILYHESLVPLDVRDQEGKRAVPIEHLKQLSLHHFLLQGAAGNVSTVTSTGVPASFHFFECLDDPNPTFRFDYIDNLSVPILGIRMGRIGLISILQDWGQSQALDSIHLQAARSVQLHPTQFREVYARYLLMHELSNNKTSYMVLGNTKSATVLPVGSSGDLEGVMTAEDFAPVLAHVWEVPIESIYRDGATPTTLLGPLTKEPWQTPDAQVVFPTPNGDIGLWPGHNFRLF